MPCGLFLCLSSGDSSSVAVGINKLILRSHYTTFTLQLPLNMKSFVITLAILCVAATAGTIVYLNLPKTQPAIAPTEQSALLSQKKRIVPVRTEPQIVATEVSSTNE